MRALPAVLCNSPPKGVPALLRGHRADARPCLQASQRVQQRTRGQSRSGQARWRVQVRVYQAVQPCPQAVLCPARSCAAPELRRAAVLVIAAGVTAAPMPCYTTFRGLSQQVLQTVRSPLQTSL